MKIKHLMFLVVVELWSLVLINTYTIERRVAYKNSGEWRVRPDTFIIPSSICSSIRSEQSTQCSEMGAKYTSNCKCVCNVKQDGKNFKSTFGFYEKTWKCFENTKVHLHGGGCSIKLNGRQTSDVLRVLPMSTPLVSYSLSLPDRYSCNPIEYSYLWCNGTWGQLDDDLFWPLDIFHTGLKNNHIWYLGYSTDPSPNPAINGRLVRIKFECGPSDRPATTHCVLFKVTGTLNCSQSPTPSSSIMFSTRRVPTSTITVTPSSPLQPPPPPSSSSSLSPSPSSTPQLRPPVTLPTPSLSSSLSPSPSSTPQLRPPVTLPTPSLSSNKFEYPSKPTTILGIVHASTATATEKPTTGEDAAQTNIMENPTAIVKRREKNTRSDDDNSGTIGGAFAGVIGLAIIVIGIIVVMRKRKRRDTDSKGTVIAENECYGRGVDNSIRFNDRSQQSPDEDEYSYAYNNVASFAKTNKQELESHTNNDHQPESSVVNHVYGQTDEINHIGPAPYNEAPVYNTLEEAVYAKVDKSRKENPSNSDAPIYNTLEEPEYANVDQSQKTRLSENHNEPLYNVLEGPETEEGLSEEPPCYQVLEGPFSEGAPVYDVLEGPESDEAPVYDVLEGPESDEAPVYGVLEGQDPHVYGALDMPDIQGSPEENRGYDDMVYDSVGDVINDQGDIYQELNQSGQRNSDVYQALNYPDKTIYLNELNQTHSSA